MPEHFILPAPSFNPTPMTVPCHLWSDTHGSHQLSFNLSQGSLPPVKTVGSEWEAFAPPQGFATPVSSSSHLITSSGPL